jgi:hypothetical protein
MIDPHFLAAAVPFFKALLDQPAIIHAAVSIRIMFSSLWLSSRRFEGVNFNPLVVVPSVEEPIQNRKQGRKS